ncbi:Crp/Fnr family transcriptional regulator [Devosia salina]|uniref:Crp/Fnr family transcriptional regulator n=1 Tax=Devosia salina TaxID=2860336 RepID=A0ABX8WE58_9HYPH|nr:Crp/Fnr family transcriptional regulator [Devosia salina]QYO76276.1 Crp/Fnr family transcriptional regulator [Devosia salina]
MGKIEGIANQANRCARCRASVRSVCSLTDCAIHSDIAALSGRRLVAAGQTILANGGQAALVGTVLAGILKVSKTLPDGRERIVSLLYPGDFFGQLFTASMDFAVEAATDAELCVADRLRYESVIRRHPILEHAILQSTSRALAVARESALLLSCLNSLERVATYLLVTTGRRDHLLQEAKLQTSHSVAALGISRADVASYLGTTIETISRHLHYLEDKGVILILDSSHFEVLDRDRLQTIAGVSDDDLRLFMPAELTRTSESRHLQTAIVLPLHRSK